jgi:Alcohol dehydrogenase GroES-like domain
VCALPRSTPPTFTSCGRYGYTPEFPTVLGSESVGVVEAVGTGVDSVEVGQRVVTVFVTGTWQELVVVAPSQIVPVPDELSDSTACQLMTNPLTALLLVRETGVLPGEWLLQTAAGSTVLSTHRQTDPSTLTIPLFARSVIYDAKTVRGFWLFRWVVTTPPEVTTATLAEVRSLVTQRVLEIPEGQPISVERFADAVALTETPAHGTKPLLVFD